MESNNSLLLAVKQVVLSTSKEHEEIMMQHVKDICAMVIEKISAMNTEIVRYGDVMKRRNIVMYGIPEDAEESRDKTIGKVLSIMSSVMETSIQRYEVDNCFRLGRRNPKYPGRPILIKLTTEWRKKEILSRGFKLKGRKVFVEEDYTKEVMERRKVLIPIMMKIRKGNKHVILKRDKMYVNGVEWKECSERNDEEPKKEEKSSKKKSEKKQSPKIKIKKRRK